MRDEDLPAIDVNIRRVLEHCKGHRLNAARMLGISERNLYRKLKELEQASTSES